jgi:tetratricopeptide (TPR) repeat protein
LQGLGYEEDWAAVINAYHVQGKTAEKLPLLRQAIGKYPDNPLFLNDLGYSLLDHPDFIEEAGQLINRAVTLEPENAYYQDSLAWFYYLTKDFEAALKHIAIPLAMENMPGEIAYHIGMIFIASDNHTAAIDYLKTAAKDIQNPDSQQKAVQALSSIGVNPE